MILTNKDIADIAQAAHITPQSEGGIIPFESIKRIVMATLEWHAKREAQNPHWTKVPTLRPLDHQARFEDNLEDQS